MFVYDIAEEQEQIIGEAQALNDLLDMPGTTLLFNRLYDLHDELLAKLQTDNSVLEQWRAVARVITALEYFIEGKIEEANSTLYTLLTGDF